MYNDKYGMFQPGISQSERDWRYHRNEMDRLNEIARRDRERLNADLARQARRDREDKKSRDVFPPDPKASSAPLPDWFYNACGGLVLVLLGAAYLHDDKPSSRRVQTRPAPTVAIPDTSNGQVVMGTREISGAREGRQAPTAEPPKTLIFKGQLQTFFTHNAEQMGLENSLIPRLSARLAQHIEAPVRERFSAASVGAGRYAQIVSLRGSSTSATQSFLICTGARDRTPPRVTQLNVRTDDSNLVLTAAASTAPNCSSRMPR